MFSRTVRTFVKNEVFGKSHRAQQKILRRAILTTRTPIGQQQALADRNEDIIINSPFQDITIPDISVDQYVFADVNKWSHKTALVSDNIMTTL